jgi:outer membrane protein TolC
VDFNDPGPFKNNELGLNARLNLFNGGRDYLRMRMAETGLAIYELDRQTIQNGLVTSVIHSFYDTLAARDFIRIAEESVDTVKTQLRIMKVRYNEGGALKSDVLSLEVRLAQAREELIRAQNSHSLSLASLSNLLGLDPDAEIVLGQKVELPLNLPESYEKGLSLAMAHRPELEKARLAVIQSRMGVDAARGEYMPRLDAQARYYADDEGLQFESDRTNWTTGMIMNWDLFTGRSTGASVKKAQGVTEEMLAADRKATLSVKLDLKTAYLRLTEAGARLEVARAGIAQAEESLRLVKAQYEGGSATVTRYLDAELARNRTEIRSTAAFYDREKARASVARAIGHWAGYKTSNEKSP